MSSVHQLTTLPPHHLIKYMRTALFVLVVLLAAGCTADHTPKPRGYFRIDFPEHAYRSFDRDFPYSFEYPVYAQVVADSTPMAEPYWINVVYPHFRAQLHISYKPVHDNLAGYLEDSRTMVNKHIQKAHAITQQQYVDTARRVYGLTFAIKGTDAASPFQFYLTDSTSHFVRGALYFEVIPNNDSLEPVIAFLREDIEHMISTFRWKK